MICMKLRSKAVGMFEAKVHVSALIREVKRGNEITITRRGVPVARLVPVDEGSRRNPREAAIRIREQRRGIKFGRLTLRRLVEEGRL